MEINERIRELRKILGYTLDDFGNVVGLKKSALSMVENGKNSVSEHLVLSVCREFGVSEEWLRTGSGEMFVQKTRNDRIDDLINRVRSEPDGSIKVRILTLLSRLSNEQWELIDQMLDMLLDDHDPEVDLDPLTAAEAAYEKRCLNATEEKSLASNLSSATEDGAGGQAV